ncbi:MAG TPA: hypothetical protein VFE19_03450 [Jatrophihabitantaceae bacterium]|nr:hypothetical protein [Jatrophihabitantaceae bacterium]
MVSGSGSGETFSGEAFRRVGRDARAGDERRRPVAVFVHEMLGERAHTAAVVDGDGVEVGALAGPVGEHDDRQPFADRGDIVVGKSACDDDEAVYLARDGQRESAPAGAARCSDQDGVTDRGGGALGAAGHLVDVER